MDDNSMFNEGYQFCFVCGDNVLGQQESLRERVYFLLDYNYNYYNIEISVCCEEFKLNDVVYSFNVLNYLKNLSRI